MHELAQAPVLERRLDLAQRRLEAPVVAHREHHAALRARRDRALRFLTIEAERLLDEHMLPRLRRRDDLLAVQGMGCGKDDRFYVLAFQEVFVLFFQTETELL